MRKALKMLVVGVFYVLALPFGLSARWLYAAVKSHVLFEMFGQMFSLCPGLPGCYARTCYYHQTLKESHLDVDYLFGSYVSKMETTIGHGAVIAVYTSIGYAEIGAGAAIGNNVSVLSGRHHHNFGNPDQPIFAGPEVFSKVTIGENTFVGERSVVMANIGRGCIVGAGSIVVKDIPDYVVAIGNPAKVIKKRKS